MARRNKEKKARKHAGSQHACRDMDSGGAGERVKGLEKERGGGGGWAVSMDS